MCNKWNEAWRLAYLLGRLLKGGGRQYRRWSLSFVPTNHHNSSTDMFCSVRRGIEPSRVSFHTNTHVAHSSSVRRALELNFAYILLVYVDSMYRLLLNECTFIYRCMLRTRAKLCAHFSFTAVTTCSLAHVVCISTVDNKHSRTQESMTKQMPSRDHTWSWLLVVTDGQCQRAEHQQSRH